MYGRDRHFMDGIDILLHVSRPDVDQVGKGNELVRETGVAVLFVRLSDHFHVNDRILVCRIETEKGK